MKIVGDDGTPLVTSFWVEPFEGATSVVLNSASGKDSTHYPHALRLLLTRLAAVDARVIDAFVDSRYTRSLDLSRDAVRLDLRGPRPFPLRLAAEPDIDDLRRAFGAAQEPIGQPVGAKGGNRNKRIRLLVEPAGDPFPIDLEGYLSGGKTTPAEIEDALNASAVAAGKRPRRQGFMQSASVRRAVERRAMDVAEFELTARGYTDFEDVSLTESFDFRCKRDGHEVHVEVKGTTSDGERVLLTRNEVAHAREWYPDVVLVVVHGVAVNETTGKLTATGGTPKVFERWELLDSALEPVSYECIVPSTPS
jgi:hypothetical protein